MINCFPLARVGELGERIDLFPFSLAANPLIILARRFLLKRLLHIDQSTGLRASNLRNI